jgi:hypothetical protein
MHEMSDTIEPPYPWGLDNTVTGLGDLNSERKMWFVDQILKCGNKASKLAKRFNLSRFAILHWVKTFRRTGILMCREGRPRVLDRPSILSLVTHCREHGYADTPALRHQIRVSHHSTMVKRGRDFDFESDDEEPPSKRTLGRYLVILKDVILSEGGSM